MAKVDLANPQMDLSGLSERDAIRRIQSYLWQLNEQLRYELTHIDDDNMAVNNTPVTRTAGGQRETEQTAAGAADEEALRQMKIRLDEALKSVKRTSDVLGWQYDRLNGEYKRHRHQIVIDSGGNIIMGPPTAEATNPNIADTAFFQSAVSAARPDTDNPPTMVLTAGDVAALGNGGSVTKNIIVRGGDGYGVVLPVNVMAVGV